MLHLAGCAGRAGYPAGKAIFGNACNEPLASLVPRPITFFTHFLFAMKNLLLPALLWLASLAPSLAQTTREVRPVPTFHALEVSSGIELHLVAGDTQRVEVSADTPENQARIQTTVEGGVLKVKYDILKSQPWRRDHRGRLQAYVTAAQLTGLQASSGSELRVEGPYPTADLQLGVSSGAQLRGEFSATSIAARLSSGAEAVVSGSTQRLEVHTSSGASFTGRNLVATECQASASSGASVAVAVQKTLSAEASSGGSVSYAGSPVVAKHTSSGGSVSSH